MQEFSSLTGFEPGPTQAQQIQSAISAYASFDVTDMSGVEAKIEQLIDVALNQDEKLMFLLREAVKRRVMQQVMSGVEVDEIDTDILTEELL